MGRSFFNLIFTSKRIISSKELAYYRVLLLIGIISHPVIGFIRNISDEGVHDPMYIRLIITFAGIVIYALSFSTQLVVSHFINFVYTLAYLVSIHILFVLAINDFSVNYIMGYFLILVAVGVIFNDTAHLRSYLIFMIASSIILSLREQNPPVKISVFISTSITMGLIIYFALRSKLVANRELDKLNKLLLAEVLSRKKAQDEVQQLNYDLNRNVSELKSINNDLEAFSYSAAHDLKSPLRIIGQFSNLFRRKHENTLDDESKEMLNTIIKSANDMDKLINDLINFARLGKKEVRKENVNTTHLVESVLYNTFSGEISEKVEITFGELPVIKADAVLIQQVFINLISNALKYASGREAIKIEISSYTEGGNVVFYVRDNGPGFDMQYSHKLFMIFQRLHSRDEYEGTGLGLAIVKRIVEKHEGKVWAESRLNEGATFYFSLPAQ